jgi:hypothetical protein
LCEARARTDTRFDTFRGNGPDRPSRNYAVLYFTPGSVPASNRQGGSQGELRWSFRVVCVGLGSDDYCLYVARLVRALFKNWSPVTDESFTSWLQEQDDDAPLIKDDSDPNDIRYSITLRYTLTTRS